MGEIMIEKICKLLSKFEVAAHQAAISSCKENKFDPDSEVVSIDESYINLIYSCNTLKEAIKEKKLIQLPITIQQELIESLESISSSHDELLAGTDTVKELTEAIEKLYTDIWRYGLNHLSNKFLGYQTKLNQLKDIERSVIETKIKLEEGIAVKSSLEQIQSEANQQNKALQNLVVNANTTLATINDNLASVEKSKEDASESLKSILVNLKNSTLSLEETQENKQEVEGHEKKIRALITEFTNLTVQLEANKKTQSELFAEFETYRKKINGLLGDANRSGMAASFTNRRRWLIVPLIAWLGIFGFSIYGLSQIGTTFIAPLLNLGNTPNNAPLPITYWEQLPLRLALTAPLIWLGWFSAKQYGYTSRVREDYFYKEASAMSFEGYKREAKEVAVDGEMLKKLLEQAIKNLGDNPIRIYDGQENHGSPFQEFFEKIVKDEKAMSQLKDLIARIKS